MSPAKDRPGGRAHRASSLAQATSTRQRDVRHLGDFTASPRLLAIAGLAAPLGALSACVAWALLRLIGLITNAVFYQRADTHLVAPVGAHQARRSCCSRRLLAAS